MHIVGKTLMIVGQELTSFIPLVPLSLHGDVIVKVLELFLQLILSLLPMMRLLDAQIGMFVSSQILAPFNLNQSLFSTTIKLLFNYFRILIISTTQNIKISNTFILKMLLLLVVLPFIIFIPLLSLQTFAPNLYLMTNMSNFPFLLAYTTSLTSGRE